jgi:hypothetical protein
MELVTADWTFAAEVKALIEQGQRLAFRPLVGFIVADETLDLRSEQSAERSAAARGENLGALNCFSVETNRNALLSVTFGGCHNRPRIDLLYARQRES